MMRSLGARLFAGGLISLFGALFLTWLALTRLFGTFVADGYERELQAVSDSLVANINVVDNKIKLGQQPSDQRFRTPAGGRYWQLNLANNSPQRSRSLWDIEIVTDKKLRSGSQLFTAAGPGESAVIVFAQDVTLQDDGKDYSIRVLVGADKAEYDAALNGFHSELVGMLAMTGLFLSLAAALQIFVGLRPLQNISKAVAELRQGSATTIDIRGPTEVRPLINEINILMENNRASVTRARARASDLAHGLKTPLTVLGQIGQVLEKQGDAYHGVKIDEQVTTIRSRVDRQLALARTASADSTNLNVKECVDRLLNAIQNVAENAELKITSEVPTGLTIQSDATDFLEALGNIVDNAMRHARRAIVLRGEVIDRLVRISVSDDGPGIDESQYDKALERGYRLDETKEGSGLGMAISVDILRAYGGSISLQRSDMGGLTVNLDWPKRQGLRTT